MAAKKSDKPTLIARGDPRLIDLQEEATKLGVDIQTDVSALNPIAEAVFCPTSSAGLRTRARFVLRKNPAVPV